MTPQTSSNTALVPFKAPIVALITPGEPLSRAAVQRLLAEGHDVAAIATFHRPPSRA